jgi:hypothetical protein
MVCYCMDFSSLKTVSFVYDSSFFFAYGVGNVGCILLSDFLCHGITLCCFMGC